MTDEERRRIRRDVISLTWPVVAQNIFRTAMFYVDTLMLGHLGKDKARDAVAVMGVCGPVIYTLVTVLSALAVGTIAIVSRSKGAGDRRLQEEGAATSLIFGLGVGMVSSLVGIFLLPPFTRVFEVSESPAIIDMASEYIMIYGSSLFFIVIEVVASSVFRAAGNARIPMMVGMGANALNVVGNYALIFGAWGFPALGVKGAALSTAVSYGINGVVTALLLFSRWSPISMKLSSFSMAGAESVRRFMRVTLPAVIEPVILQSGFLVFSAIIYKLGTDPLAAHRIAICVESAAFMPFYGFAVGCSALVGQSLGEKDPLRAQRCFRESMRLTLLFTVLIMAVFALFPRWLIWIFIPDSPSVIDLGALCILIAAVEQPVMAMAMVYGGALRGAGDTKSPVLVAVVGVWLVRVPLSYLLGIVLGWGLTGIWWTMVADWLVRTLIFAYIYGKGKWKDIQV